MMLDMDSCHNLVVCFEKAQKNVFWATGAPVGSMKYFLDRVKRADYEYQCETIQNPSLTEKF